jgi:hypothetical protein
VTVVTLAVVTLAVVTLAVVFGRILPQLADYGDGWDAVQGMSN